MSNPARAAAMTDTASPSLTYEPYFGLREKAFSLAADPRFLYTGRSHVRPFEQLLAGIRRREGLIVLSGEIGTGKTTLCRGVLEHLDRRTFSTFVRDPFLSREDLLKTLLIDFGVMSIADLKSGRLAGATRPDLSYPLYEFLDSLVPLQAFAVLIIDEAQNLSPALLEEIRILSELEAREKLLQVVLVGQPELQQQLALPQLRQLDQRVSVRCELAPLPPDEVKQYITHRLRVASVGEPAVEFTPAAVRMIADASAGVPRVINLMCDRALHRGFEMRAIDIEPQHVAAALEDLRRRPSPGATIAIEAAADTAGDRAAEAARHDEEPAPVDMVVSVAAMPPDVTADAAGAGVADDGMRADVERGPAAEPIAYASIAELSDPLAEFSHESDLTRASWLPRIVITAIVVGAAVAASWTLRDRPAGQAAPPAVASVHASAVEREAPATVPLAVVPGDSVEGQRAAVPAQQPARGQSSDTANAPAGARYAVQVASFQSRLRAARLVNELAGAAYKAEAVPVTLGARGQWWQVLAGRYGTREEAERHLQQIRERPYYADARLVILGDSTRD